MKKIFQILIAVLAFGSLFSCEPTEDRESLPGINHTADDLKFTVTTNDNTVALKNLTQDVIAYWTYSDATGKELGHFNTDTSFIIPFAGTYKVSYTAYTRGGAVEGKPVTVTIAKTDLSSITKDPKWGMLTNGATGKTWVLDFVDPVGWAGLDYPASSGDNWAWLPTYSDNSWVMPKKDWGEMYFDLNEGYNTSVTQTELNTSAQTTKKGNFTFDIDNNKLIFNAGVEMLYGGDYHPDVSNWVSVKVIELTATSLRLGVIRDQSRKGEGKCQIVFHYKPKPNL